MTIQTTTSLILVMAMAIVGQTKFTYVHAHKLLRRCDTRVQQKFGSPPHDMCPHEGTSSTQVCISPELPKSEASCSYYLYVDISNVTFKVSSLKSNGIVTKPEFSFLDLAV